MDAFVPDAGGPSVDSSLDGTSGERAKRTGDIASLFHADIVLNLYFPLWSAL